MSGSVVRHLFGKQSSQLEHLSLSKKGCRACPLLYDHALTIRDHVLFS